MKADCFRTGVTVALLTLCLSVSAFVPQPFFAPMSLAQAQEKKPGDFDREMSAFFPPAVAYVPDARMDENAILRTRRGPGFDLVTAMWPVTNLGGQTPIRLPGRRFIYDPMVGYVGEDDRLVLDFGTVPFVCRTLFESKQVAPSFSVADAKLGGEVSFTPPALAAGRMYNLTIRDAAGAVRWQFVFDRTANLPRRLFVALNEKTGEWRATLTDCATGLKTERTFAVSK